MTLPRRQLIIAATSLGVVLPFAARAARPVLPTPAPPAPETHLPDLSRQLTALPRRREFTTLPRLLDHPDLWDDVAFDALRAYRGAERMIGTGTALSGSWPVEAQNLLNSEIFAFGHPDALLVMALWGEAQLALYDEAAWSQFDLARLTSPGQSPLPLKQSATGSSRHHQDEFWAPMARRGAVFRHFRHAASCFWPAITRSGLMRGVCWHWVPSREIQHRSSLRRSSRIISTSGRLLHPARWAHWLSCSAPVSRAFSERA